MNERLLTYCQAVFINEISCSIKLKLPINKTIYYLLNIIYYMLCFSLKGIWNIFLVHAYYDKYFSFYTFYAIKFIYPVVSTIATETVFFQHILKRICHIEFRCCSNYRKQTEKKYKHLSVDPLILTWLNNTQQLVMSEDGETLLLLMVVCICKNLILCDSHFKKKKSWKIWVDIEELWEWLHRWKTLEAYSSISFGPSASWSLWLSNIF